MSNNNKDYFTEMLKLLVGMGIIAIVIVFVMRLIFAASPSTIDPADESAVNNRLKAAEIVNLVGAPVVVKTETVKAEQNVKSVVAKTEVKTEVANTQASATEGESLYKTKCVTCHGPGVAGAPVFGNKEQWAPRIAKGMDVLINTALNGSKVNPAMMPKGGATDLSDAQVKSIVEYMVSNSK